MDAQAITRDFALLAIAAESAVSAAALLAAPGRVAGIPAVAAWRGWYRAGAPRP